MTYDNLTTIMTITEQQCLRCGHEWLPRIAEPVMCPACKSRHWESPRTDAHQPTTSRVLAAQPE